MIEIIDKKDCCGCTACASTCAKKAISMMEDEEGFLYPKVDKSLCNDCGVCNLVCPIRNPIKEVSFEQRAVLFQHNDSTILKESTSGGLFTAIASWIIRRGGVVFGAAYDGNMRIRHVEATEMAELSKFRNSKYAQSEIGDAFLRVRQLLKEDKWVLFSGTPCQMEGLYKFLYNKSYPKLILVNIVCHSCPSPKVFRKYIEMVTETKGKSANNVKFRDKVYGYNYSQLTFYDNNGNMWYKEGIDTDVMLRAFFNNISPRPSCFSCVSKKQYSVTDFSIWDCFDVVKFSKELDNDKGVTRALMHTPKAWAIWEEIKGDGRSVEIDVAAAVQGVREMYHSVKMNPDRAAFFADLNTMPVAECFQKWFPVTIRHRVEKQVRLWSNRLGIYMLVKKLFWQLHGKGDVKR